MAFRENAQILGLMREHAVTDALTELGNRRCLVAELDRVLERRAWSPSRGCS